MKKLTEQKLHEKAMLLYGRLAKSLQEQEQSAYLQGFYWSTLKETGLYRYVYGDEELTFREFVDMVGVSYGTVHYKMTLYRVWVKELNYSYGELEGINTRKLFVAASIATAGNCVDLLNKATMLGFNDFYDEVKKLRKKKK